MNLYHTDNPYPINTRETTMKTKQPMLNNSGGNKRRKFDSQQAKNREHKLPLRWRSICPAESILTNH